MSGVLVLVDGVESAELMSNIPFGNGTDDQESLADRSTRRLVDRLARLDILLIDELAGTGRGALKAGKYSPPQLRRAGDDSIAAELL